MLKNNTRLGNSLPVFTPGSRELRLKWPKHSLSHHARLIFHSQPNNSSAVYQMNISNPALKSLFHLCWLCSNFHPSCPTPRLHHPSMWCVSSLSSSLTTGVTRQEHFCSKAPSINVCIRRKICFPLTSGLYILSADVLLSSNLCFPHRTRRNWITVWFFEPHKMLRQCLFSSPNVKQLQRHLEASWSGKISRPQLISQAGRMQINLSCESVCMWLICFACGLFMSCWFCWAHPLRVRDPYLYGFRQIDQDKSVCKSPELKWLMLPYQQRSQTVSDDQTQTAEQRWLDGFVRQQQAPSCF